MHEEEVKELQLIPAKRRRRSQRFLAKSDDALGHLYGFAAGLSYPLEEKAGPTFPVPVLAECRPGRGAGATLLPYQWYSYSIPM
jgi:hypothetical protein